MGAHLNAYTSREQTVFYAKCFKKDLPKGNSQLWSEMTTAVMISCKKYFSLAKNLFEFYTITHLEASLF